MNIFPERILQISRKLPILLLLVFFSCNQQSKNEVLLDKISHVDFEDILTIDGVVDAVRSSTLSCPRQIEGEVIFLVEDGTIVKDSDVVCVMESRELKNEYDELLLEVDNAKANLNKSKADLDLKFALLDAQVKSMEAQTEISNLDSLQLKYSSPNQRRITELGLQRAALEKKKIERRLKVLETINKSQIRESEIKIKRWESRASDAKGKLDKLTIRATQPGMAIRAISWLTDKKLQEGDQAWGGMPLVNIPDMSEMKVTIMASESSYKRINLNDPVEFSFDAMPGITAWGKILIKAPIGQPISSNGKVKVFEIEASIDSSKVLPDPGFTAICKVVIKRINDTIVVPQLAIFDVDSMKVVYVRKSNGYEKRQVLLAASSPNNAVIAKGLSGKEKISLIKPSSSLIKSTKLLPVTTKKKKKTPSKPPANNPPKKIYQQ